MERQRIEGTEMENFVGNWKTNGRLFETYENPEMEIIGTDTYELILDGFFLLHKALVIVLPPSSLPLQFHPGLQI